MTAFITGLGAPGTGGPGLRRPAPRVESSIVSAIGGTPLVALDRLFDQHFRVFAKCERFNPGGSIKDRPARSMIERALKTGVIVPGTTTVVESTSGNLGIALAQVCAFYGIALTCVTDPKATAQNVALMRAYGARVEVVDHRDPSTGEYLPVRVSRVQQLLAATPDAYWPNQYASAMNSAAHRTTMQEIWESLDGSLDYLFCTAGSCGTLRGCAEYVAEHRLPVTVCAVDAMSSVIFGPPSAAEAAQPRRIPGHGAAIVPALFAAGLADRLIKVSDDDCVRACRALLAREAILAGGSSGAVVAAVAEAAAWIEPGATCAVILADGGDRYLDTIYSDAWVRANVPSAGSPGPGTPGPDLRWRP